jgi:hypothetical protein
MRTKFNLEAALNGAKLVTRDGWEVKDFKHSHPEKDVYQYSAIIGVMHHTYSDDGKFMVGAIDEHDLFLADTHTPEIIGEAITEPMLSAEEWYRAQTTDAKLNWSKTTMIQAYGNYVADFLTKNK